MHKNSLNFLGVEAIKICFRQTRASLSLNTRSSLALENFLV